MQNNTYKKLSSLIYNYTKPPGFAVDDDIQFYKQYIIPIQGKVLELGSGNGRFLIPFLKYKVDIEGVEISTDMNYYMNSNLNKLNLKTKIYESDFISTKFNSKYELIVAPNGWLNLISHIDLPMVFKKVFSILENNGSFIFDLIYPKNFKDSYQSIVIDEKNYDIFIENKINNEFLIQNKITFKCKEFKETEKFILYKHKLENNKELKNLFTKKDEILNFNNIKNNNTETKTFIFTKK